MTRYSRSTACAEGSNLPGGFRLKTNRRPSAPWRRYVGLDCPPLNCSSCEMRKPRKRSSAATSIRWRSSTGLVPINCSNMPAKAYPKSFSVSHLRGSRFERRGLRSYFEYRDLGIERATRGKVVAHVIRARPGKAPHGEWHTHDCNVQFVYVLKGWVLFEYEGVGRVLMKAGSCFYQPPNIRHREIRHSKDIEMLEVVAPAQFKTYDVKLALEKPAARRSPARRSRG